MLIQKESVRISGRDNRITENKNLPVRDREVLLCSFLNNLTDPDEFID